MLIALKNQQRNIVSVVLSLFIGSWLLLLCQACLASPDHIQMTDQQMSEMTVSCHEPVSSKVNNDSSKEHCYGACDCDGTTVTLNSDKHSDPISKIKFTQDLYAYIEPQITVSNKASSNYRIHTPPERAILLPHQTYNVLLI